MAEPQITARSQYVICLAGHIDHGKSALVHALTGAPVDRLSEERRRGITIELGFAHFSAHGCQFALIDVPGHERFVHTMVAGASGVDAALLVVAADDSVMPQTREHVALLNMLGVCRGVIAITKCDLADEEHLGLVELEIEELLAGTFLAGARRIRVSAHEGIGIEALREALVAAARSSPARSTHDERFRLPIDRAFSPAGQGTVVTGTIWRGTVRVGDILHLLPSSEPVRIRRLQSQGRDVESLTAGERAAINLVGIKATAIRRGDELITPGTIEPGRRYLIKVQVLPETKHALKHRQIFRLHLGASQVTAQVLLDQREVLPGQSTFAALRCASPTVAEYGQPFVLRQLSPAATIGGGTILAPALRTSDRFKRSLAVASGLASANPATRLNAYIELRREATFDENGPLQIGLDRFTCDVALQQLLSQKKIVLVQGSPPYYLTVERFDKLKQKLIRRCRQELERRRPASQVPVSIVLAALAPHASPTVLDALLADMVASREIVRRGERIGFPSGAKLSQRQQQQLGALLAQFAAAGPAPPTHKELSAQNKIPPRDLEALIQVALDEGQLVQISPLMAMEVRALEALRQSLAEYFQQQPTAKVGQLREQWEITRKHAVPIFEYFDQQQITSRAGDLRSPGPRLNIPIGE